MSEAIKRIQARLRAFQASPEGYGYQLRNLLASIIVDRLDDLGWTQAQLAERMGVPESFVSRLVHSGANFQADVAGRVLHALGLPPVLNPYTRITEQVSADIEIKQSMSTDGESYGEEDEETYGTAQGRIEYSLAYPGTTGIANQSGNKPGVINRLVRHRASIGTR